MATFPTIALDDDLKKDDLAALDQVTSTFPPIEQQADLDKLGEVQQQQRAELFPKPPPPAPRQPQADPLAMFDMHRAGLGSLASGALNTLPGGAFARPAADALGITAPLEAGTGDAAVGLGQAAQYVGRKTGLGEGLGHSMEDWGKQLQGDADVPEYNIEHHGGLGHALTDPVFYRDVAARGVPTLAVFAGAATLAGLGSEALLGMAGLGAAAESGTALVGAIGVALSRGAVSRFMQGAMEAGSVYEEAKAKGMDEAAAGAASDDAFTKNMAMVGLDAAMWALPFAKLEKPVQRMLGAQIYAKWGTAGIGIARTLGEGALVGAENAGMAAIHKGALGDDVTAADLVQAAAPGAVMGLGMGAAAQGGHVLAERGARRQIGADLGGGIREGDSPMQRLAGAPEPTLAGASPELPNAVWGDTAAAIGPSGNRYPLRYAVVPLDDLVVSHDWRTGREAEGYDQALQGRDRGRAANMADVRRYGAELDPGRLLGDFGAIDRGTPIVGPDMQVESGNGRSMGLHIARAEHPENWRAYQDALRAKLPDYGIDPSAIEGVVDPVLVRVREGNEDRAAFAAEANQRDTAAMSTTEQAGADVGRISEESIGRLDTLPAAAALSDALKSNAAQDFLHAFTAKLPKAELNQFTSADGGWSQDGLRRIENALLLKTYGESGDKLLAIFRESADEDVARNVRGAVVDSLPTVARAESMVRRGQRGSELSIADDVGKVVDVMRKLADERLPVKDYLAQAQMFGRELTPEQERLLTALDANRRSAKRMRALLETYAQGVIDAPATDTASMFGDVAAGPTKEALLAKAEQAARGENPDQGQLDFGAPAERPAADTQEAQRDGGEEAAAAVAGAGGADGAAGAGGVEPEKSKGHLAFIGPNEYVHDAGYGTVKYAPIENPIGTDGWRQGLRFESKAETPERIQSVLDHARQRYADWVPGVSKGSDRWAKQPMPPEPGWAVEHTSPDGIKLQLGKRADGKWITKASDTETGQPLPVPITVYPDEAKARTAFQDFARRNGGAEPEPAKPQGVDASKVEIKAGLTFLDDNGLPMRVRRDENGASGAGWLVVAPDRLAPSSHGKTGGTLIGGRPYKMSSDAIRQMIAKNGLYAGPAVDTTPGTAVVFTRAQLARIDAVVAAQRKGSGLRNWAEAFRGWLLGKRMLPATVEHGARYIDATGVWQKIRQIAPDKVAAREDEEMLLTGARKPVEAATPTAAEAFGTLVGTAPNAQAITAAEKKWRAEAHTLPLEENVRIEGLIAQKRRELAAAKAGAVPAARPAIAEPDTHWLRLLPDDRLPRVYAVMRDIGHDITAAGKREAGLKPVGGLAVGAADFDPFIQGEALREFLTGLRRGMAPKDAAEYAKAQARAAIEKHNARRPKDINWARSEGSADAYVNQARLRVEHAEGSLFGNRPEAPTEAPQVKAPPRRAPETRAPASPGRAAFDIEAADAFARRFDGAPAAPETSPHDTLVLSDDLAKAGPRYGYGVKKFQLRFESDLDKTAYILAQTGNRSKSDARYLALAQEHTGATEDALRAYGQRVRDAIKAQAAVGKDGQTLTVARGAGGRLSMPRAEQPAPGDTNTRLVDAGTKAAAAVTPEELAAVKAEADALPPDLAGAVDDAVAGRQNVLDAQPAPAGDETAPPAPKPPPTPRPRRIPVWQADGAPPTEPLPRTAVPEYERVTGNALPDPDLELPSGRKPGGPDGPVDAPPPIPPHGGDPSGFGGPRAPEPTPEEYEAEQQRRFEQGLFGDEPTTGLQRLWAGIGRVLREGYDRIYPARDLDRRWAESDFRLQEEGRPTGPEGMSAKEWGQRRYEQGAHAQMQVMSGSLESGLVLLRQHFMPLIKELGDADRANLARYWHLRMMEDVVRSNPGTRLPGGVDGRHAVLTLLNKYRADWGEERFNRIAETQAKLVELRNTHYLDELLRHGLVGPEEVREFKERYPNYLPWQRGKYDLDAAYRPAGAIKEMASVSSAGIFERTREGSDASLSDPLQRWLAGIAQSRVLISRNMAARTIVEAARTIEEATGKRVVEVRPAEDAGTSFRASSTEGGTISFFDPAHPGQQLLARLPPVWESMAKNLEAEPAHWFLRVMSTLAAPLRLGATTLNLAFMGRNFFRDAQTAFAREGIKPFTPLWFRAWRAAWSQGEGHWVSEGGRRVFKIGDSARTFADAADAGVLQSGRLSDVGTSSELRRLERETRLNGFAVKNVGDALLLLPRLAARGVAGTVEGVKFMNEVIEQTPRIATYLKVRERGMADLDKQAASMAARGADPAAVDAWRRAREVEIERGAGARGRDVTVDFAKSGNLVRYLNQMSPFFNARIQGAANTVRLVRDNPVHGLLLLGGPLAMASMATYTWNSYMGQDLADQVDQFEWERNWPIIIGSELRQDPHATSLGGRRVPILLRIPKGELAAVLTAPVETAIRMQREQKPWLDQLWEGLRAATLGLSPVDDLAQPPGVIMPPIASTWYQLGTNRDAFRNRDIVPTTEKLLPPEEQYGPETAGAAVYVGRLAHVSPRQLDFALRSYTAGIGNQSLWLADVALGAAGLTPEVRGAAFGQTRSAWQQAASAPVLSGLLGVNDDRSRHEGAVSLDAGQVQVMREVYAELPELKRLGVVMGEPGDKVAVGNGVSVDLTPQERAKLQMFAWQQMKPVLSKFIQSPGYQKLSDPQRRHAIDTIEAKMREGARAQILMSIGHDELKRRITNQILATTKR